MKLLLATLHSRYIHASLALPSLAAACADISGLETVIREQTINELADKVLIELAGEQADIIAFSCYIWNIEQTLRLAAELKLIQPQLYIIFGGPEVSFGSHELMAANPQIDLVVRGEGEVTFRRLMQLLTTTAGEALADESLQEIGSITFRSGDEIVSAPENAPATDLDRLPSPFAAGLVDSSKPLVYLETSRGCPFSCSFCLSSIGKGVRSFSMARIESDLALLMQQGAGTIKLVDRTFNYDSARANQIWAFILQHNRSSRFHFEIAADLLTDDTIALLKTVPPDTFRFEIGVQSTAAETLAKVARKSDLHKLRANVRRLQQETAITLHLDLVAGLPGEDFAGFLASLEEMLLLKPDHIQVGLLKMLKGTAIRKTARENGYCFSPFPPYRILGSRWLSFEDICRIEEIGDAVEAMYNSGRYRVTLELLARHGSLMPLFGATRSQKNGERHLLQAFEEFSDVAIDTFPALRGQIRDTLRFDYCMSGHPGRQLPVLLQPDTGASVRSAVSHKEVAARLALPGNVQFRTFTTMFNQDYSVAGRPQGATEITFVYGKFARGQKVLLLTT
jgi:anaerobic magnesium-protoporphyrin IX monomethyl ester cyclase